jgi:hypothetical protein
MAIGLEIELNVPIDRLTPDEVSLVQNLVKVAKESAALSVTQYNYVFGLLSEKGNVPYGPVDRTPKEFRVDADHDSRTLTERSFQKIDPKRTDSQKNGGWPPREGGATSLIELVVDPPVVDEKGLKDAFDKIGAFVDRIKQETKDLTKHWANTPLRTGLARISVGPLDYQAIGYPLVRQPNHGYQGSIQVNVGIDLREYHSFLSWYLVTGYSDVNLLPEEERKPYLERKEDIEQAIEVGRKAIENINATLSKKELADAGNSRGLRGFLTHLALHLLVGKRKLAGGSLKNVTPILMKSPNTIAALYGMTIFEQDYYDANRGKIVKDLLERSGRSKDAAQSLKDVLMFPNIVGLDRDGQPINTITVAEFSNLTSGAFLTGKPVLKPTGVGPKRDGNKAVAEIPTVKPGDGVYGQTGANSRGGVVLEVRALPGYVDAYSGMTEAGEQWRKLAARFLKEADSLNSRDGVKNY